MPFETLKRIGLVRPRILWIVLVALLVTSVLPLGLYHLRVLRMSREKLEDTERVQQTEITRSVAEETIQFESSLRRQLFTQRQFMTLAGWVGNVNDTVSAAPLTRLLQNFVESNPEILYVTAVGKDAKGQSAGSFPADRDPFADKALKRAFTASIQGFNFVSDTFALGPDNRPAFVISVPLMENGQFTGMLAAVVSLDHVLSRLNDVSVRDRTVYIVNGQGEIVVHPDGKNFVPGQNVSKKFPVVGQFAELPRDLHATQTTSFLVNEHDRQVKMIGTYSTIPELHWAVVAQRSLEMASIDAGVGELTGQAVKLVVVVVIVALVFGYIFAVGITTPIRGLVESTRAISRGNFQQRAPVRGTAEISALAETFNKMAGDIGEYVKRLQEAAAVNRELFLGSIQMLAAAIDEKDPYTRGHSGRVARYSVIIGEKMGLAADELDRLRISALLHDVGKIGVDDRVLKKPGQLTDEEFDLMKQHPVKGANIMRPVKQLAEMLPGIELHHEHIDGRGYPYGLAGDKIPMMARIIAVADTFDAVTTDRPYQSAMDADFALSRIRHLSGSKFDPAVVDALQAAIESRRIRLAAPQPVAV